MIANEMLVSLAFRIKNIPFKVRYFRLPDE